MYPDLPIAEAGLESSGGVKSSVGERRRAAAVTSSDPAPNVESVPGTPRSWALRCRSPAWSAALSSGATWSRSASAPATCGAAKDVPARPVASKPKRSVERMPVPAATSDGNCARVTARRADAGEGGDRRGVGRGADRERLRQVRRRCVGRRSGAAVAGGEDREDVRGPQGLEIGLELAVAARQLRAPRGIDDVGRVVGRRVAVGIQQPLEGEMDCAVRAHARVVEDARGDEAGAGRHADAPARDHHADDLRAVTVEIGRCAVLAEGIEPAVGSAAIAARELRVGEIDAGVERRDRHSAAVDAVAPAARGRAAAAMPGSTAVPSAGWMASSESLSIERTSVRRPSSGNGDRVG